MIDWSKWGKPLGESLTEVKIQEYWFSGDRETLGTIKIPTRFLKGRENFIEHFDEGLRDWLRTRIKFNFDGTIGTCLKREILYIEGYKL